MYITSEQSIIREALKSFLAALEAEFQADVISWYGHLYPGVEGNLLPIIERLAVERRHHKLVALITSDGGSLHSVERCVQILRHHYEEVEFVVPDYCYSAGTVFCLSGDALHMDYFSVLGPTDPQVRDIDGRWVPAEGYLRKADQFVERSANKLLTEVESLAYREMDLAKLFLYEQAKDLVVQVVTEFLLKYRFQAQKGVSAANQLQIATHIAETLADPHKWKSHDRNIHLKQLAEMGLEVDDYSNMEQRQKIIRSFQSIFYTFALNLKAPSIIYSRNTF